VSRPDVTDLTSDDSTRDRQEQRSRHPDRDVAILAGLQSSRLLLSVLRAFNERSPNFAQLGRRTSHA
jgi:hypothetical protein